MSFPEFRIACETFSSVYDSNSAFFIVGASCIKGSFIDDRASIICLPVASALDVLKNPDSILNLIFSLLRPISNSILCLLNNDFK